MPATGVPRGSYFIAYANGRYANEAEAEAEGLIVVGLVDVNGTVPVGDRKVWLDIENGDATPATLGGWGGFGVYTSLANWANCIAEIPLERALTIPWWIADWTGQPHLPTLVRSGYTFTAAGCQYQSTSFDLSVFDPSVLDLPAAPVVASTPTKAEAMATLNQDIVTGVDTPTGLGYWLVASDGGVFAFGDATPFPTNPVPGLKLNRPIVSAIGSKTGHGLLLIGGDGGTFALGDAPNFGSLPAENVTPAPEAPVEH